MACNLSIGSLNLGKIFNWFASFLNSMDSPINGFGINEVKVNTKGDIFSSLFSFNADTESGLFNTNGETIQDAGGNPIALQVLLQVINAKSVLDPIFTGLNNLDSQGDPNKQKDSEVLLNLLLGSNRKKDGKVDNSYQGAKSRGTGGNMAGGLLGVELSKCTTLPNTGLKYAGKFWSWKDIAEKYLKYSLECEAPGKEMGAIENIDYDKCSPLIGEYLEDQAVVISGSEVKINPYTLVLPIMISIQEMLVTYFNDVIQRYDVNDIKEGEDGFETEEDLNKAEAKANRIDIYEYDDNGELKFTGKSVDRGSGDLSAQLTNYAAHGFVGEGGVDLMTLASKHINLTLKKITGTTDVELVGISANYKPSEVLDDVEDIIYQDEFLDTLTEDPLSVSVSVDDDGYDIEQCDTLEIDPCESLGQLFQTGVTMYRNLYIIHWLSKGNDMMKLHLLAEDLYEELIKEIDTMGELLVEKCGTIPTPDWCCEYATIRGYEFQEGINIISDYIHDYISTIDYAYPNQTADVQSTFDEWIRFWSKEVDYFLKNQKEN